MKVSLIISEDVRQIMFTPESEQEKIALKMISKDDKIELAVKEGSFYGMSSAGYRLGMCNGGYLRAWEDEDSIMLVITPKKDKEN